MLYRALLLFLGLVLGQVQRHPMRTLGALQALVVRYSLILATTLKLLVCLPWRVWRVIDGPTARAFALVMGLIVLFNLLASSSALAGWATLFIVGASRGLTGPLRRQLPSTRRWQSTTPAATPVPAPFDAAAYAATLAPFSDLELRRQARDITQALRGGDPSLTEEDRYIRVQRRRVIYETLDARRAAQGGSARRPWQPLERPPNPTQPLPRRFGGARRSVGGG